MEQNLSDIIIRELIHNEPYNRKVLPFLKQEYFSEEHADVFQLIGDFVNKYNKLPTIEVIKIEASNKEFTEQKMDSVNNLLDSFKKKDNVNLDWLVTNTEKYCQSAAIDNALTESILITQGKHKTLDKGSIPKILQDALAVSFDSKIGHDYLEDYEARYDLLHSPKQKIPFHLTLFNKITRGGVQRKTLNLVSAASGVGKTIFLCDLAAHYLSIGYNVMYFTLEMAEELIGNRIDANLLDISLDHLDTWTKEKYMKRMQEIKNKYPAKLLIKEFPPSSAHVGHFRHVIHEAKIKKNFIPDVIISDYLGIALSARLKSRYASSSERSMILKAVAEEYRGMAIELNVPFWSAVQFKRSDDIPSGNVDMDTIGESVGIQQTMDFGIGLVENEALEKLGQVLGIQLKNRYNSKSNPRKFLIGLEKPKMKFYDIEESAQKSIEKIVDPEIDEYNEIADKIEEDEKDMKIRISKEKESESYKSGYHHQHLNGLNRKDKKSKFSGLKV